jgi:hypothetical protein
MKLFLSNEDGSKQIELDPTKLTIQQTGDVVRVFTVIPHPTLPEVGADVTLATFAGTFALPKPKPIKKTS